jgi:hypothetical protein
MLASAVKEVAARRFRERVYQQRAPHVPGHYDSPHGLEVLAGFFVIPRRPVVWQGL